MAIQNLDPIANVNSLWTTNTYTGIAKGVRQPTAPSTATEITCDTTDNGEVQTYICSTPELIKVTQTVLWFYASVDGIFSATLACVAWGTGGTPTATQDQTLSNATPQWFSLTFSFTADYPSEIKFSFNPTVPLTNTVHVYAAYVEVTGTQGAGRAFPLFMET